MRPWEEILWGEHWRENFLDFHWFMKSLVHKCTPVVSKCLFFTHELCVGGRYLQFFSRGSSWPFRQKNYIFWGLPLVRDHLTPTRWFHSAQSAPKCPKVLVTTEYSPVAWALRRIVSLLVTVGSGETWGKTPFSSDFPESSSWEQWYSGVFFCLSSHEAMNSGFTISRGSWIYYWLNWSDISVLVKLRSYFLLDLLLIPLWSVAFHISTAPAPSLAPPGIFVGIC